MYGVARCSLFSRCPYVADSLANKRDRLVADCQRPDVERMKRLPTPCSKLKPEVKSAISCKSPSGHLCVLLLRSNITVFLASYFISIVCIVFRPFFCMPHNNKKTKNDTRAIRKNNFFFPRKKLCFSLTSQCASCATNDRKRTHLYWTSL